MTAAAHWTCRWIGRPWLAGTSDCWSLARAVWAHEFNREVPALPVDPRDLAAGVRALRSGRAGWIVPASPAEGDAVLMARAAGAQPCHIGVWVAPDRVLHALERTGAVCTPATRLAETGYRMAAVLRHPDWSAPSHPDWSAP